MSRKTTPQQGARNARDPLLLSDVTLQYPDGTRTVTALKEITLSVPSGTMYAVLGPSGSGKSSLLGVAAALISPTRGSVIIDGVDMTVLSAREKTRLRQEKIGVIFQQPNLLPSLTALEQLLLQRTIRRQPLSAARTRAWAMLEAVGLADQAHQRPHQLSGGQRQRVNIARALMNRPKVLLIDEPTSALDHERGASILQLLHTMTREFSTASILVTHDRDFVAFADAVTVMRDGALTHDKAIEPNDSLPHRSVGLNSTASAKPLDTINQR